MRASINNLFFDLLLYIFELLDTRDLLSVLLVNRVFYDAVAAPMYSTLTFTTRQAKNYPELPNPFSVILSKKSLAVHVRCIDVQTVPVLKKNTPNPQFLSDLGEILRLCYSLKSWVMGVNILSAIVDPFLSASVGLKHLRIRANLAAPTALAITNLSNLQTLALDAPSWNVIDVLPKWAENLNKLRSLTVSASPDLNESVLTETLRRLVNLKGLRIVGCPLVGPKNVSFLLKHTPLIEHLSFSIWDHRAMATFDPLTVPRLYHVAIDAQTPMLFSASGTETVTPVLASLLQRLPPLQSLKIRAIEQCSIAPAFVRLLLDTHGSSLSHISFARIAVEEESLITICTRCIRLRWLEIPLTTTLLSAVKKSISLEKLIDSANIRPEKDWVPALTSRHACLLFQTSPTLKMVTHGTRVYTRHQNSGRLEAILSRNSTASTRDHWFWNTFWD